MSKATFSVSVSEFASDFLEALPDANNALDLSYLSEDNHHKENQLIIEISPLISFLSN